LSKQHETSGEIDYDPDVPGWNGKCVLPAFAEYGCAPHHVLLDEPDEDFRQVVFPLTIQDYTGSGPSVQQANAILQLRQNERVVLRVVITELFASYRAERGWTNLEAQWPFWRRLVHCLIGKPYETIEDLKPATRCLAVEVSTLYLGDTAFLGFEFAAQWEYEHGLAVVYHPAKGAFWGDGIAITSITEADNINERLRDHL